MTKTTDDSKASDEASGGEQFIDHVAEARQTAMRAIEDWEYLNDEEKYGSLHKIVDHLASAEREAETDA